MAKKSEIVKVLKDLAASYPSITVLPITYAQLADDLQDLEKDALERACRTHRLESAFFPTAHDLRRRVATEKHQAQERRRDLAGKEVKCKFCGGVFRVQSYEKRWKLPVHKVDADDGEIVLPPNASPWLRKMFEGVMAAEKVACKGAWEFVEIAGEGYELTEAPEGAAAVPEPELDEIDKMMMGIKPRPVEKSFYEVDRDEDEEYEN